MLENDCEKDSEILMSKLEQTVKNFSVKIKCKRKEKPIPWINAEILSLMKERDSALKQALKVKTVKARNIFVILRNKVVKNIS